MTESTIKLLIKLAAQDEASKAVRELRGEIDETSKTTLSFTKLFASDMLANWTRSAVRELRSLSKEFVETAANAESLTMRFDLETGGFGKEAYEEMLDLSRELRADVDNLAASYLRMKNMGLAATREQMTALVEFSRATGKGQEAIDSITLQLAQIKSKERASMEDLRRMAEAGLPAFTILAEKLHLSAKQVESISESGLEANDIINALFQGMADKAEGANERFFSSWNGMVAGMRVTWKDFQRDVMSQGAFRAMKMGMQELVKFMNTETGRIQLANWAKLTANAVVSSFKTMASAANAAIEAFRVFHKTNAVGNKMVFTAQLGWTEGRLANQQREFAKNKKRYMALADSGENQTELEKSIEYANRLKREMESNKNRIALLKTAISGSDDVLGGNFGDLTPFDAFLKQIDGIQTGLSKSKPTPIRDVPVPSLFSGKSTSAGFARGEDPDAIERELSKFFGSIDKAYTKYYRAQSRLATGTAAIRADELDAIEAQIDAELDMLRTAGATEEELARTKAERMRDIDQQRFDLHLQELRSSLADEVRALRSAGISAEETAKLVAGTEELIDKEKATRRAQLAAQSAEFARQDLENSNAWAAGWQDGMQQWQDDLNSGFEHAQQMARDTAEAMSSSFSDFFFDTMRGDLDSLGDYVSSFLQSIQRSIANVMGQMATRAILGSIGLPIPGFASGGVVTSPTLATVGEAGPEAIIPLVGGAVPVRFEGGAPASQGEMNVRVQIVNQSKQDVQASAGNMRYDSQLREWVLTVVIDGIHRNVMGIGSMMRGAV